MELAAPIDAGIVLSQPQRRTTPSMGWRGSMRRRPGGRPVPPLRHRHAGRLRSLRDRRRRERAQCVVGGGERVVDIAQRVGARQKPRAAAGHADTAREQQLDELALPAVGARLMTATVRDLGAGGEQSMKDRRQPLHQERDALPAGRLAQPLLQPGASLAQAAVDVASCARR